MSAYRILKLIVMKRSISFILLIICSLTIFGQRLKNPERNQLSAEVGLISTDNMLDVSSGLINSIFSGTKQVNNILFGSWFLSYGRHVSDVMTLGVTAGFDRKQGDLQVDNEIVGQYAINALTFAGETKVSYVRNQTVQLYFMFGLGYTIRQETGINYSNDAEGGSVNHLNLQFDYFGFRFGRKVAFTGALGIGYKGLIRGGVSYQF